MLAQTQPLTSSREAAVRSIASVWSSGPTCVCSGVSGPGFVRLSSGILPPFRHARTIKRRCALYASTLWHRPRHRNPLCFKSSLIMYSPRAHKNVLGQSATSVTVYRTCPRVRVGMPYAMDNALPRPLIPPPGFRVLQRVTLRYMHHPRS